MTRPEPAHALDYVRTLYKHRRMALTVLGAVLAAVSVYTFTARPTYEATARLIIEVEDPTVVGIRQVLDASRTAAGFYETQYRLLQSRDLARRTVDALELWHHPVIAGRPGEQDTGAPARAVDAFLQNFSVRPVRDSRIVDLVFRSSDPRLAADVVNAHAKSYLDHHFEMKLLASQTAAAWLDDQLARQREAVEKSEALLARYRERKGAISLEAGQDIAVRTLIDLNAAVTRATTERMQKEALASQLMSPGSDPTAADTVTAVRANGLVQRQRAVLTTLERRRADMAGTLGQRHPRMIEMESAVREAGDALQRQLGTVARSVRQDYLAARAREDSLVAALEAQKKDALALGRTNIQYSLLRRDVESNRDIYESLLKRVKEIGVSSQLRTGSIRVLDAAEVPRTASSPGKGLNLLMALFGGLMLAVGAAFSVEYLNDRIKTPDEIRTRLGLPFLGITPMLAGATSPGFEALVDNGVPPSFVEAFRSVRTHVLFSASAGLPRSIVVTSTIPKEGKTLVACNLAISLAQAGYQVLLVDGDLRRPQVSNTFALEPGPGLSNLLVGDATLTEVMRKARVPGLCILSAGRIPPNPAELLGSQRFKDLVASFESQFDCVVIDSPPIMAVTDAVLAAGAASGALFVVGTEMVACREVRAAMERLAPANTRILGAVLNRVDLDRHAFYYASYYQRPAQKWYPNEI